MIMGCTATSNAAELRPSNMTDMGTVVVVETDEFMRYICRDGVFDCPDPRTDIALFTYVNGGK
jgi:hypothetical protein